MPDTPETERRTCGAGQDGDCFALGCPQVRDNEPWESGRFCPLPPGNPIVALRETDGITR